MKIFISGPVSGPMKEHGPIWVSKKFDRCADMLSSRFPGCVTVNPMDLCKTSWSWARCMAVCLIALRKCDAICLMEGHEHSRGSRVERKAARAMRMAEMLQVGDSIHGKR